MQDRSSLYSKNESFSDSQDSSSSHKMSIDFVSKKKVMRKKKTKSIGKNELFSNLLSNVSEYFRNIQD